MAISIYIGESGDPRIDPQYDGAATESLGFTWPRNDYNSIIGVKKGSDMYKENEARNRVHPNHLSYNQCLDKLDMKAMRFFTTKDELSARNIEGTLQSALHEHLNPVIPAL